MWLWAAIKVNKLNDNWLSEWFGATVRRNSPVPWRCREGFQKEPASFWRWSSPGLECLQFLVSCWRCLVSHKVVLITLIITIIIITVVIIAVVYEESLSVHLPLLFSNAFLTSFCLVLRCKNKRGKLVRWCGLVFPKDACVTRPWRRLSRSHSGRSKKVVRFGS